MKDVFIDLYWNLGYLHAAVNTWQVVTESKS